MFVEVTIPMKHITLAGHLSAPAEPRAWVIFAHGSGSSRFSSRNNWVAAALNKKGYATLLFDLLTADEDLEYQGRFNIPLLSERLLAVTDWLRKSPFYHGEPLAYFGASTGAGAALMAASQISDESQLCLVISRGGRPDLAGPESLRKVSVPVLLIVGGLDEEVIELNELAQKHLHQSDLRLVEGATHLFEEKGTLGEVVQLSLEWLDQALSENIFNQGSKREQLPKVSPGDHQPGTASEK